MASLRTAKPWLRSYFKENYIPQVCEALLCGLLATCPEDPLRYLEVMIKYIIENGLERLLWDICIDPAVKPKIRRLSETYLEQLFGLEDQLMTPELMTKACNFYTGNLIKTYFRKTASATDEETQFRIQNLFYCQRLIHILTKWRDKARHKTRMREDELLLKHEIQLRKWKNKPKSKLGSEKFLSPEENASEISLKDDSFQCDISLLPGRALLQIFRHLSIRDLIACGQVCHSWMLMTQTSSLWNAIDFSTLKCMPIDKYVVSTLQRWRLNVLHLNFRGCFLKPKTLRSVSHCRNLQELNVSDCITLTDDSMKHISEGCPGVLYLNLSNTAITNRTMRLLPRNFPNLQNLSLAYCKKFTDKGLQYLNLGKGCHKLTYLDLSGCTQISVQGFKNIANSCSGIMHLTINDMPTLTDNCVKALVEKCSRITSIVFIGAPHISDCAFKALSTCNLRKIRFEGNKRITDSCFKFIDKHYPNIRHIYMVDCKGITDGSLRSLSVLRQLTVLNLANCVSIGDVGLKQFLEGPVSTRIRELNLSNCINLGDASIIKLSERCPNLNYLNLRNCEQLTDMGIGYIVSIFSLISVDLSGTVISNQGFCKGSLILEHLDVSYCRQLSDEIIKALAIYCISLTSLSVAGCPKITDAAMELLSAKCHYLHILDISGCILLTDKILENLERGCDQLRILKMRYCKHISEEAALRMSAFVQHQDYSPEDPPHWFGYDCEGKSLTECPTVDFELKYHHSVVDSFLEVDDSNEITG
ncbi:PREDICTED: F-box/LRR-repeat protein 13 [Chrysochloris asiatica]|uniref:F-box/LRR-repeat protein 13 n=1 Tax=Chrysochloris asiatica TaxID=185453 RepID=A0A9B0T1H3_CHRAS|nr:PREDICTED: F-box/LRR-repeat protein 13 [Chrysochloris asiatica]